MVESAGINKIALWREIGKTANLPLLLQAMASDQIFKLLATVFKTRIV